MSQSNPTNTMKVKVIFGQDIRRWRYSKQSSLSSLNEFVTSSFNLTTFWLQYEDDEGDRLTLSSQNDFQDAFDCAQEESRKSLKIYIIQGSLHNAQRQKTSNSTDNPKPQNTSNCHEIKQAAIDFLQNPAIIKLLPDLQRRIFEEIHKKKTHQESAEYKPSETTPKWDSPQSIEDIMRNILTTDTKFAPIISHQLYKKKLNAMIPHFAVKISHHLPVLMSFSTEAIASWIPHLAAVIGRGLNTFVSSTDAMSSFFPLMCSFMRQHGDYTGFDENGKVIHYGVRCDECAMVPIKGARFKCCVCSNYDLCGQCESLSKHDANHPMIKFGLNANEAVPPFMGLHDIMTQFGHGPHHWFGHHWKQRGRRQRGNQQQHNVHGFQPHVPPHPPMGHPPHQWWNQDGDHWGPPRGHRGWKRCHRYQGQWQQGYDHDQQWNNMNAWCVNRQNEVNDTSSNAVNTKDRKMKVMADFVCDVTLQDRTRYPTDTVLTKTWKMRNNGEHEWGNNVELVFFKGNESLTLEKRYPVVNAKPGQEVEVSAAIKTPKKPGRYCSYYRLQRNGEYFGPRVWVDIFGINESQNNDKTDHKKKKKQMKLDKKEAKLEAKQLRLEAKQSKIASKIEDVSKKLDEQNENDDSLKLIKKQSKLQEEQSKMAAKVSDIKNKQKHLELARNEEDQLLDDIVAAAVKDLDIELNAISCVCGATLHKTSPIEAYSSSAQVNCDICGKFAASSAPIYHCPNEKSLAHAEGYDLCCSCAEYQMQGFVIPNSVKKQKEFVYKEQLEQLRAMGFNDDNKIKNELIKQKGNVQRVANQLLLSD